MSDLAQTLQARAKTHGDYIDHANFTQSMKDIFHNTPAWDSMANHQRETLDMIAHKIGRILAGDPSFHDHWHDIAGYAHLSADRLKAAGGAA